MSSASTGVFTDTCGQVRSLKIQHDREIEILPPSLYTRARNSRLKVVFEPPVVGSAQWPRWPHL
jgi:hypothetical protein